jgi:predicted lipoprotein with Yx(FWY)xxD motif
MPVSKASQHTLRALLSASVLGLSFIPACVADEPGIADESAGSGSGGKVSKAGSGGAAVAGSSVDAGGVAAGGHAGSAVTPMGGAGGNGVEVDQGGAPTGEGGQMQGQAGQGEGGVGTTPVANSCIFHTDAVADPSAGGAGPVASVVLQTNAFVGSYLTDTAGRTLYTYGADLPGDCVTPPSSGCVADCLVSWPPFDAGSRVLGTGLDDAAFGSIDRGDGTWQTTYYGWPLYYYKTDLTLGQLTGQGKGKTWHVAELIPPSVQIMKNATAKYLGDTNGHTLYVSAADQVGTDVDDPASVCEDECLNTFKPFREKHLSVVTSLNEAEFTVFARRGAGGLQLAYKGLPLYLANTDVKSGDMTGLDTAGFTAALP